MLLKDLLIHIKHNVLFNTDNLKVLSDENLIRYIDDGLFHIHSIFNVRYEQAIIVVPSFRHNFILKENDPHVVMSTYSKLTLAELEMDNKSITNLLATLFELKGDKLLEKKKEILSRLDSGRTIKERIIEESRYEVLQLISAEDNRGRDYVLNQKGIFQVSTEQIYLPEVTEGDIVYIIYKPKPRKVKLDEHIDLPETLLRVLYSYIALEVYRNTTGFSGDKYPSVLQTYDREVQNAHLSGAVTQESLATSLEYKKGFY